MAKSPDYPDKIGWWRVDYQECCGTGKDRFWTDEKMEFEVYDLTPVDILCVWHSDIGLDCDGTEGRWEDSEWVGHIQAHSLERWGKFTYLGKDYKATI